MTNQERKYQISALRTKLSANRTANTRLTEQLVKLQKECTHTYEFLGTTNSECFICGLPRPKLCNEGEHNMQYIGSSPTQNYDLYGCCLCPHTEEH